MTVRRLLVLPLLLLFAACPSPPKYPSCDGDKDCQEGEKCVNKKCVKCAADPDCGPNQTCVDGSCARKPGTCAADGDCAAGEKCQDQKCVAKPVGKPCQKDDECAEDEDCVNQICVKGGGRAVTVPNPAKCTPQTVFFGFDQYTLSDETKATLQKNFECLKSEGGRKLAVVGHTDSRGTAEYNVALSDDRAQAVVTYLGRLGAEPARMRKVPKGASDAKGSSEASYGQDRRVEFVWE